MNACRFRILLLALMAAGSGCAACHTCDDCDCAAKACRVEAKPGKEKRNCWEVECEDVCVPGDVCPCEDPCAPRCGRVRRVAVLKQEEYECDACKYEWKVEDLCPPCDPHSSRGPAGPPDVPPAPGE